jgi:hypothetical protein
MKVQGITVHCRTCNQALTVPLALLANLKLIDINHGKDLVPQHYYITLRQMYEAFQNKAADKQVEEIEVNLKDIIGTKLGGIINGCCGVDGMDGINTFCLAGHPVGTENSDCWMPHHMSFALANVVLNPTELELPDNYESRCNTATPKSFHRPN